MQIKLHRSGGLQGFQGLNKVQANRINRTAPVIRLHKAITGENFMTYY